MEYKLIPIDSRITAREKQMLLNEQAASGWRLVDVEPPGIGNNWKGAMYLERPKK
jgi:hypothetical protein